jgi:hypothetical protein
MKTARSTRLSILVTLVLGCGSSEESDASSAETTGADDLISGAPVDTRVDAVGAVFHTASVPLEGNYSKLAIRIAPHTVISLDTSKSQQQRSFCFDKARCVNANASFGYSIELAKYRVLRVFFLNESAGNMLDAVGAMPVTVARNATTPGSLLSATSFFKNFPKHTAEVTVERSFSDGFIVSGRYRVTVTPSVLDQVWNSLTGSTEAAEQERDVTFGNDRHESAFLRKGDVVYGVGHSNFCVSDTQGKCAVNGIVAYRLDAESDLFAQIQAVIEKAEKSGPSASDNQACAAGKCRPILAP